MAVYKVIQDVEAEDKLLGPLTLKGFVYAIIAGVLIFIDVRLAIAGSLGPIRWPIIFILLFPIGLFGILASPLGREQPTEVWLLSHLMFFIKPKKRLWNQSGQNQLVTITAPKKIERQLTKGFSQVEVKSRLQALATTLDSHGWAIKNINVNLDTNPTYFQRTGNESDRLVGASVVAQSGTVIDIHAKDDILDEANNPRARQVEELMEQADATRRKSIMEKVNAARESGATPQPGAAVPLADDQTQQTQTSDDDLDLAIGEIGDRELRNKHPHFQTKPSLSQERQKQIALEQTKKSAEKEAGVQAAAMTAARQADKMELAQSGNDLSVASVASLVNRHDNPIDQISPNEVVISLH